MKLSDGRGAMRVIRTQILASAERAKSLFSCASVQWESFLWLYAPLISGQWLSS